MFILKPNKSVRNYKLIYKLTFTLILIFGTKAFAYAQNDTKQTRKPSVLAQVDQAKIIKSKMIDKQFSSIVKTIDKSKL